MLLAVMAVALGVLGGLLAGRRPPPGGLSPGRTDRFLLVAGAVAVLAGRAVPATGTAVTATLAGYALLAGLAARHRRHPGMAAIAAGILSNLVVMAVNGGMPVGTLAGGTSVGLHHGLRASDHLRGLADVIILPGLGMTVSPGDLVLALGGAVAAFGWMRAQPDQPARSGRA